MEIKKILVCDDDEGILDMLALILEETGHEILVERNSLNVLSIIEAQSPDLILLDLWMPVISGDQLLKSIRSNPRMHNLPVIVISASRDGRKIAEHAGASAYIAKPFDYQELIDTVETCLGSYAK
ncbi:response regulator [Pedobacter rhodius]|uniref:Response regulator n=1 Tax=Pedobacter rhodius TaxID=3004098 RepID=A0ABT4KXI3_9SPHI|nr:response regulator [Pedobacter sp. SJ11]MCZ4223441.1 response regulator [Pedobacter sp. SJ11]